MAIDYEVGVGGLFVLADSSFDQRSIFHCGKAEGQIFADSFERSWAYDSLAACGIERGAASVGGYFGSAPIAAGDAVEKTVAVITPHWKMIVGEAGISSGRAEEKNVLLGGTDDVAQSFGEQLAHPRAAGEDVVVGFELRAV